MCVRFMRAALLLLLITGAAAVRAKASSSDAEWELRGNLAEACTCSPPCSCNYAVGSSPHDYCWFIFSLKIKDGHFGSTDLEGLRLAAGIAGKGIVWYIDSHANAEQAAALQKVAESITAKVYKADGIKPSELPVKGFKRAQIEQYSDDKGVRMVLGDAGGFDSRYILGLDGKSPVVVENNWSWNMSHARKAKTSALKYHDEFGNRLDVKGTNASCGEFEWTSTTQVYFR